MANDKDPTRVRIVNVRLSYPSLWKPKGFGKKNDGEPAYQASFIIDPKSREGRIVDDLIYDAIDEAKYQKWGKNPPTLKSDKICYKEGDPDKPEEDGMMILASRNLKKPKVFDIERLEVGEGDDGAPYAGCYVDAIVRIWAQDNDYGKRINCSLEAVRFRDDGDAFGAPPVDPDEFDEIDERDRPERSSRRSRDRDEDDRGSRRSRDEDGDDRGGRRSRDRDEGDDRDDRGGRRSRRDDDGDDDRGGRRSRDSDDERGSRRRGRDEDGEGEEDRRDRGRDRDDGDRGSSRRSRRDEEDDDRGSRRGRDEDEGRSSSRRSRRDDDDGDRDSRRSRRDRDVV